MIEKFKNWWFRITHVKCNYCNKPVEVYYEAYLIDIKDQYKADRICINCIKELNKSNIIFR